MSNPTFVPVPPSLLHIDASPSSSPSHSVWERISDWTSEHKAVVYTIAGVTVVATAAGAYLYLTSASAASTPSATGGKKKGKGKKKAKSDEEKAEPRSATATAADLPLDPNDLTEEVIANLSEQERKELATKLKAAGNKQFGSKNYNKAIELYTKAIELRQDPIYYSNRAACHQALGDWDKVIEDTTAAINLDSMYVKALNRRANAYEQIEKYQDALMDYTASCIIDKFQSQQSANKVEVLLQKVATQKGQDLYNSKKKKLPSVAFVSNYLSSYRSKPIPADLDETAEISETSGQFELRKALLSIQKRSWQDYNDAFDSIIKAIEVGDLGSHEALAYNIRATFRWLVGDTEKSMEDINKSIELDPDLIQSYVKRATMFLENENKAAAEADFAEAARRAPEDPDVYYNRGQSHFIMSEFSEASADYQKSIDFDPDFMFSHIQMAVTQYKQGSIASALATFRKNIKKFPKAPEVYNYFGEILLDQGQFQKAIENFDTAIDLERTAHPQAMNVLPLVNKALTMFQWKQDLKEAQDLCQKALLFDEECDIAVATMAQLVLHEGNTPEALKWFEKAAELSRTLPEIVNALQYAEATRTQLEVQQKYPQLASVMKEMSQTMGGAPPGI